LEVANEHKDQSLIVVRDQDILQIILDTIYMRANIDSDQIEKIQKLAESPETTFSQSNLGNLQKSKNQQAFIDKHLRPHAEFINLARQAQMLDPILSAYQDSSVSFKDLLIL
jgi:hypothetical protein